MIIICLQSLQLGGKEMVMRTGIIVLLVLLLSVGIVNSTSAGVEEELENIVGYQKFVLGEPIENFEISTYQGPMDLKSPEGEEIVRVYYLPCEKFEFFDMEKDITFLTALGFMQDKLESVVIIFYNFSEDFEDSSEIISFIGDTRETLRRQFPGLLKEDNEIFDLFNDGYGKSYLLNNIGFIDLEGDEINFWGTVLWSLEDDNSRKLQSYYQTLTFSSAKYLEAKEKIL